MKRFFAPLLLLGLFSHYSAEAQDLYLGNGAANQTLNFLSQTNSYSNIYIGYGTGDNNNVLSAVNINTLVSDGGDLQVGIDGSRNSMAISNGGNVISAESGNGGVVGLNSDSYNNSVIVSGLGSLWSNSGDLTIGVDGSTNSLIITNGGSVYNNLVNSGGVIGQNFDAGNNSVLVTGAGSLWSNSADLVIGLDGSSNSLTITNGGTMANGQVNSGGVVGFNSDSVNNKVLVTGAGSLWTNSGDLTVGIDGSGNSVVVTNGGTLANGQNVNGGVIGQNFDSSNNSVLVTGTNSLWTSSGDFIVGIDGSSNSLTIANGGAVYNGQNNNGGVIGANADSTNNKVLVTGTNSLWSSSGDFTLGVDGSGNTLIITNGGTVANSEVNNGGVIGQNGDSSNNRVLVTGPGSLWTNNGDLIIGLDGSSNSLVITNGGIVANDQINNGGVIGQNGDSSNNRVLVAGTNSLWTNSGDLIVGLDGSSNSLIVTNGAILFNGQYNNGGVIGQNSDSSNNRVLITGANSLWTNSGDLIVGLDGSSNSLVITNGGLVSSSQYSYGGVIGQNSDASNNLVLVTGSNSVWANSGDIIVGIDGSSNSLIVTNGATLANNEILNGALVGQNADASNNKILITGKNSLWTNSGDLTLGVDGSGNSLIITNGGAVFSAQYGNGGVIGQNFDASNNKVLVTGTNSLWSNSGDLIIGFSGSGNSLVITNGGLVTSGQVTNGTVISLSANSSNNSVLVTGKGSLWSNSATLTVGFSGGGALTLANGGAVSATNIVIAAQSNSIGVLNLGTLGRNDTNISLSSPAIVFGSGSGTLNFNQSDTATVSSLISGNGTMHQLGSGTTILSAANTFTGTTIVSAGTLLLSAGGALQSTNISLGTSGHGKLDVSSKPFFVLNAAQLLSGYGIVNIGTGTLSINGTLAPGSDSNGTGIITVLGNLNLGTSSTCTFNIDGTNAGSSYDQIGLTNDGINYGGNLSIQINTAVFTPSAGSSYNLFSGFTNDSGDFTSVALFGSWNGSFTPTNGVWSYSDPTNNLVWTFNDATGQLALALAPEPSASLLLFLGLLSLLLLPRRRETVRKITQCALK